MTATTAAVQLDRVTSSRKAAVLWAPLGAALMLLILVALGQWLADGVHSVDPGPDHFGGVNLVVMRLVEWGQFAAFLYLVWRFCVRPLARTRTIAFDGLFILVSFTMNFWDPLDNYWTFSFQYNAHFLNVGSWGDYIPGWHGPGASTWAVPLAFIFGCYTWSWFAAIRLGSWILNRLKEARPTWSRARCFLVVYLVAAVQAGVSENIFMRLQHWTYPTIQGSLTAFEGHSYAFPLFNPFIYGLTWVVMIWMRESVDDSGLSYPETGIAALNVPAWSKNVLRYLSMLSFASVIYIVTYFLPFNLLVAHGEKVTNLPSYFPLP